MSTFAHRKKNRRNSAARGAIQLFSKTAEYFSEIFQYILFVTGFVYYLKITSRYFIFVIVTKWKKKSHF